MTAQAESAQPETLASKDVLGLLMNSLNASLHSNHSGKQEKANNRINISPNKSIYEELQMGDLKIKEYSSKRKCCSTQNKENEMPKTSQTIIRSKPGNMEFVKTTELLSETQNI